MILKNSIAEIKQQEIELCVFRQMFVFLLDRLTLLLSFINMIKPDNWKCDVLIPIGCDNLHVTWHSSEMVCLDGRLLTAVLKCFLEKPFS